MTFRALSSFAARAALTVSEPVVLPRTGGRVFWADLTFRAWGGAWSRRIAPLSLHDDPVGRTTRSSFSSLLPSSSGSGRVSVLF